MMLSLLLASAVPFAPPLEFILDRTASIRVSEEGENIATFGFGMFRTGWQYTGTQSADNGQGNPTTARAVWSGGEATVVGGVTELADGLRFQIQATTNANVGLESAHLYGNFPTPKWAGSIANVDGTNFPIPLNFAGTTFLRGGNGRSVKFSKGDLEVTIEGDASRPSVLQDSRQWSPHVEWRFNAVGGTWNANTTRTYTVTLKTNRPYTFSVQQPYTITAGPDWAELPFPLDVTPGSALDWSSTDYKRAGSEGWLESRNGHFYFPNNPQPQRFYGVNLAFSAMFLSKKDAEKLATRLARMGYNAVRLHHFDSELTGWSGGTTSTGIFPDKLDQLNYLVAMLKKRGIYISLDLYTIRQIRNNEVLSGATGGDEFKALQLVNQTARNNWLAFSTNLLNSLNPYTGLRWKDDPAIAWIVPVNENNMGSATRSLSATSRALFDSAWQNAGNTGSWNYQTDAGARFGANLHANAYAWMKTELRNLGVKALLSDVNGWHDQSVLVGHRSNLDYVDNHFYWDHPNFLENAWSIPSRGWDNGGMATKVLGSGLQSVALSRVYGKPFTLSEFNFAAPNRFRAEGGLLLGSIAARQDWDAAFRFAWSHNSARIQNTSRFDYFDMQADPIGLASERAIIALFLRRDLDSASDEGVLRIDPNGSGVAGGYNALMRRQILSRKLYSSTTTGGDGNLTDPTAPQPVQVDTETGTLTVNTPRTQGIFAPVGSNVTAGGLSALLSGHRGALWVTSVDRKPIPTSNRILLTFLTDVQNTNIRYSGPDRDVIESWGITPHLVRVGSAAVTLAVQNPARYTVYRLDMAGNRIAEIPVTRTTTTLSFNVTNSGPSGQTLYHEISGGSILPIRRGPTGMRTIFPQQ